MTFGAAQRHFGYPALAKYNGAGNIDAAENFTCRAPNPAC
jgi:hypothetical protein